jgi:hypothetical protein
VERGSALQASLFLVLDFYPEESWSSGKVGSLWLVFHFPTARRLLRECGNRAAISTFPRPFSCAPPLPESSEQLPFGLLHPASGFRIAELVGLPLQFRRMDARLEIARELRRRLQQLPGCEIAPIYPMLLSLLVRCDLRHATRPMKVQVWI